MHLITGRDIWRDVEDRKTPRPVILCITTNAQLNKNGELVMGAGIAKQAKERYPNLAVDFGQQLWLKSKVEKWYGLLSSSTDYSSQGGPVRIMAFQTKVKWKDQSSLDLIKYSTAKLTVEAWDHRECLYALNFPGINHGGLLAEMVEPIIAHLPDNVYVYRK